jgi:hypothetical protein
MDVSAEKPNPLLRNCARLSTCLHRSSVGSELSTSFPSLPAESSNSPPPIIWPPGPCCPQTQTPKKRVHLIHTML